MKISQVTLVVAGGFRNPGLPGQLRPWCCCCISCVWTFCTQV